MKIDRSFITNKIKSQKIKKNIEKITQTIKEMPQNTKKAGVTAALVLAVLGGGKCTSDYLSNSKDVPESVINPVDLSQRDKYVEKGERTFYTVQKGDNPEKIAKKFNISTRRLLHENGMKFGVTIYPDQKLSIPESQTVTNINSLDDISKLSGLSGEFLDKLVNFESAEPELYKDKNGNWTIGIGHAIKNPDELNKYQGKTLDEKEMYNLLAQDLLDLDLDFGTTLNEDCFNEIPQCIKESCMDLMFNKGLGAVSDNDNIMEGLRNKDYEKVISNLTQDYSIRTNADGSKTQIPASGLSKRRLYDISHASLYFKGDVPSAVTNTAKNLYERGLKLMEEEKNRGELSETAYPNVRAEYKDLAYQWFDGRIGEKLADTTEATAKKSSQKTDSTKEKSSPKKEEASEKTETKTTKTTDSEYGIVTDVPASKANTKIVLLGGNSTKWTCKTLHEDWKRNAKSKLRPFPRPIPEIDASGKILPTIKVLEPTGKGKLSGKTFIINPGHGGCMNQNANFDPGASNAVMSKKNPDLETNVFIGNGGKALEEWFINMKISNILADRIRGQGGKVVYVQGSIYTLQNEIDNIRKKYKADMLVSMHSNSSVGRGIYVIGNKRGGTDVKDDMLAKKIKARMEENNWFNGLVTKDNKSLAILSKDDKHTLEIPAVLVETGNLKDKTDVANLNSRQFREYMVDAIVDGINDYIK